MQGEGVYPSMDRAGGICPGLGVSAQGGVSVRGMSAPVHAGIHPPCGQCFLTHACENITFPQWRVNIGCKYRVCRFFCFYLKLD